MIQINGFIISNDREFRDHFDLEAMSAAARLIASDYDIFAGLEEYEATQEALAAVVDGEPMTVTADSEGAMTWRVGDITGSLRGSMAPGEVTLTPDKAVKALISVLGGREYSPVVTAGTAYPEAEAVAGMVEALPDQTVKIDPATGSDSIAVLTVVCKGDSGCAVATDGSRDVEVRAGTVQPLLVRNGRICAVLPMRSSTSFHSVEAFPSGAGEAEIVVTNSERGTRRVAATVAIDKLRQVCADSEGGFLLLTSDGIVPYSRIAGPDAVDDLCLPAGADVVMIALSGSQLLALTADGRTFSNFRLGPAIARKGVVAVGRDDAGHLFTLT